MLADECDVELVTRFFDHANQLNLCAGVESSVGTQSDKQCLALMYRATKQFKDPRRVLPTMEQMRTRKAWTAQTCVIFLSKLSNFVDFCFLYLDGVQEKDVGNSTIMHSSIKEARRAYRKKADKAYRQVRKDLRARVPSGNLVRERAKNAVEVLHAESSGEKIIPYKHLQALNFFILQSRLNVRSGPILNFTWEEFEKICESNKPVSSEFHKTAQYYDVFIFVLDDQRQFLRRLKLQFQREFNSPSKYVFASSKGTKERSISRHIQETFRVMFGDDPQVVKFNANSIRKYWEKRWQSIKNNHSEGVSKAHFAQTGHCEKTAQDIYIGKEGTMEDRMAILDVYQQDLLSGEALSQENMYEEASDSEESEDSMDEEDSITSTNQRKRNEDEPSSSITSTNCIPNKRKRNEDEPSSSSATPLKTPKFPKAPRLFNAVRNSLNSPCIQSPQRDSFQKSLESHRGGEASSEFRKCCRLFFKITATPPLCDVIATCEEAGLSLTEEEYNKLYAKIKAAVNKHLKK